jgi:hypothetical protein
MIHRVEGLMRREDGSGSEDIVGGECIFVLTVVIVDRACIRGVDGFLNVLTGDGRDLGKKGFP